VIAKRLILVLPAAILATLAGVLVTANFAGGSTPPPTLDRVSNPGTAFPAPLSPREEDALEGMPGATGEVKLMGAHEGRAFYRVGPHCFGTGLVSGGAHRFESLTCTPEFPSTARPLLDMTVFHGGGPPDKWPPTALTVWRSEGFAADGVAKVTFVDDDGSVVAETTVTDNTYRFDPVPTGTNLRLVAYSKSGERVFEQPKRTAKNP
jgi:hypothetical protein